MEFFMRKKKNEEVEKQDTKSRLLSKFESMEEESSRTPVIAAQTQTDTASMLSSETGTRYLEQKMTEEIVLWKKVYTKHIAEEKNFSKYTQRIEGLFVQINPDASLNIEFTNPQSIHTYEEIEDKILNSFRKDLFPFLVAGSYDTHVEIESNENGTNVYISRLVEDNLMEGRDELIQTLQDVKALRGSPYGIYEKFTETRDGRDLVLIGVKIKDTNKVKAKTKNNRKVGIRTPRKEITV